METLPSDGLDISYSFNTPVAANVLVAPDTFLATMVHAVDVISPSVSICPNVLRLDSSGVDTNKVAVNQLSPLPYVYNAPPSVVAILSSGLPICIAKLVRRI
jgi:hypothetical protein